MSLSHAPSGLACLRARPWSLAVCAAAAMLSACSLAALAAPPSYARTKRCTRHHHRRRACRRQHSIQRRSASTPSKCPNAATPATGASAQVMDAAVLCLINHQRSERNLPALREQAQLDGSAEKWVSWMVSANQFTHGSNFAGRILAAGYLYQAAGENIATGYPTPTAVVNAWMHSADHCRNILTPTYRDVGTGVSPRPVATSATGPATWSQDFGLSMSESAPSENWGPANGCPY